MSSQSLNRIARGDELSNHYEKVEFDCCGHPKLESNRPRCTNCGYWWYDELDEVVNRGATTGTAENSEDA